MYAHGLPSFWAIMKGYKSVTRIVGSSKEGYQLCEGGVLSANYTIRYISLKAKLSVHLGDQTFAKLICCIQGGKKLPLSPRSTEALKRLSSISLHTAIFKVNKGINRL